MSSAEPADYQEIVNVLAGLPTARSRMFFASHGLGEAFDRPGVGWGRMQRVNEALAGNRELQSDVQRLDSGLVDEDQEPPDKLNYLTEDDLPSEIPSSDVALREIEEFLRQNQQDPGPNSGSDDPSDSA